jgi:hypothetical protein
MEVLGGRYEQSQLIFALSTPDCHKWENPQSRKSTISSAPATLSILSEMRITISAIGDPSQLTDRNYIINYRISVATQNARFGMTVFWMLRCHAGTKAPTPKSYGMGFGERDQDLSSCAFNSPMKIRCGPEVR